MRLRLVQKDIERTDLVPFVQNAEGSGIELICFSELAATGCLYEPCQVEPLEALTGVLASFELGVMFGTAREEAGRLHNSYVYVQNGQTQVYDKIHLFPPFDEDKVYLAGETPGLFTTPFGECGVAICYDIRFDEIFERLGDLAVPYTVIPAAFPRVRIEDWRSLLIQRAMETKATVIGVNAVGNDGNNEFGGSSMIIAPDGSIIVQADETSEQVIDVAL